MGCSYFLRLKALNVVFSINLLIGCWASCCRYSLSDCQDYRDLGHNTSAVYRVVPLGMYSEMNVYCDQVEDGGGWIVNILSCSSCLNQ